MVRTTAARIGVSVNDGVVTLPGTVTTFAQKWTAERTAGHVFGVRAVANDLDVTPDAATSRTDSTIAQAVANALEWDSAIPDNAVKATVTSGWVTLTGTVGWQFEKSAAERAVRNLYGVKGVTNSLIVKPHVSVGDVKAKIESAFKRSAEIDAQRVKTEAQTRPALPIPTARDRRARWRPTRRSQRTACRCGPDT